MPGRWSDEAPRRGLRPSMAALAPRPGGFLAGLGADRIVRSIGVVPVEVDQ